MCLVYTNVKSKVGTKVRILEPDTLNMTTLK